jgi:uncharacterized protein YdbL (DUF1318 family)
MNSHNRHSLLSLCLFLAACVTVNIYFPAAAAEQAADRIIQDIYGKPSPGEPKKPEGGGDTAPQGKDQSGWMDKAWDLLVPRAEAQEPDIDISTPGVNKLRGAMKSRHGALSAFYGSGAVGMTQDGLLTVRDAKAVPLQERNRVKQLVAEENRDRNALYAEIARANGHPEWERQIRTTFAGRWVANAPSGWWYQNAGGAWVQK